MRVLFVCIGNICRSPMAEAMARQIGGEGIHSESAGIMALDGRTPGPDVLVAAEERGFDLTAHRARWVGDVDLEPFDRIVALDRIAASALLDRFHVPQEKLVVLHVEDPYGEPLEAHRVCAEKIEVAVRELVGRILAESRGQSSSTGA